MKEIKRDLYLNKLIDRKENDMIKVITGIRRCGKSYLLFELYYKYLLSIGVDKSRIIKIALDSDEYEELNNAKKLGDYIRKLIKDDGIYYIFLDEVQFVDGFEKVLNGLNRIPNLDIYVTGSNSKFLSTDILTEFRGRGDEVRIYPLSFYEFVNGFEGTKEEAWNEYITYGGLPLILSRKNDEQKSKYLNDLFEKVYFADIIERNNLQKDDVLEAIVNMLASSIGSLTNPTKIANTFESNNIKGVSDKTVSSYINFLMEAFMINKVERYDIKGKKYIGSPLKYYYTDVGLRNARLNFRQQEENHIMENIIYNELCYREFNVDVGVVEYFYKDENKKSARTQLEIDFVANKGSKKYYIQSTLTVADEEKRQQEIRSLNRVGDSFKKIVVVKDNIIPWHDENGILYIGIEQFLLEENAMDL